MEKRIVGIIGGRGLMGNFFAKFFRRAGLQVLVSDRNTKLKNRDVVVRSNIVLFAVPIENTKKIIADVASFARRDQLLMDVTSIKVKPMTAMMKSHASVIGLHPLFRPGPSGFSGQTVVMCVGRAEKSQMAWLQKLFEHEGARVVKMSAKKHDEFMAIIQVLVHFHSIVFGLTLKSLGANLKQLMEIMSPVYRIQFDIVCRIFAQNPGLYASIAMENPEMRKITRNFLRSTKQLTQILQSRDTAKFLRLFKKTSRFLGPFSKKALQESDTLISIFRKS